MVANFASRTVSTSAISGRIVGGSGSFSPTPGSETPGKEDCRFVVERPVRDSPAGPEGEREILHLQNGAYPASHVQMVVSARDLVFGEQGINRLKLEDLSTGLEAGAKLAEKSMAAASLSFPA
jgi:hypothetical protein